MFTSDPTIFVKKKKYNISIWLSNVHIGMWTSKWNHMIYGMQEGIPFVALAGCQAKTRNTLALGQRYSMWNDDDVFVFDGLSPKLLFLNVLNGHGIRKITKLNKLSRSYNKQLQNMWERQFSHDLREWVGNIRWNVCVICVTLSQRWKLSLSIMFLAEAKSRRDVLDCDWN